MESVALESAFTKTSGSWQHALGEHGLADDQLAARLQRLIEAAECDGA
jgi:hypothetical protein